MNDCAITFPLFGGIDSGKNLLQSATSGADVIIATLASISTQSQLPTSVVKGGKDDMVVMSFYYYARRRNRGTISAIVMFS